jgi:hypothetical protein
MYKRNKMRKFVNGHFILSHRTLSEIIIRPLRKKVAVEPLPRLRNFITDDLVVIQQPGWLCGYYQKYHWT